MLGYHSTIPDDSGRRHVPVSYREMLEDGGETSDSSELRAIFARHADAQGAGGWNPKVDRRMLMGMLLTLLIAFAGQAVSSAIQFPYWAAVVLITVLLLPLRFLLPPLMHDQVIKSRIEMLTYYARCATCGFSLRGLPLDDVGRACCPECTSAWRTDRFASAEVLATLAPVDPAPTRERPTPSHVDGRGGLGWLRWSDTQCVMDALERPISLAAADFSNIPAPRRDAVPRAVLEYAQNAAGSILWRVMLCLAGGGALVFFGWRGAASLSAPQISFSWDSLSRLFGVLLFAFGCAVYVTWLPRLFSRRTVVRRERFKTALLSAGHCPSCLSELIGQPINKEGRVRCPGCAAVWMCRGLPLPLLNEYAERTKGKPG